MGRCSRRGRLKRSGRRERVQTRNRRCRFCEFATVNAVMLDSGTLFIADTYINEAPNATADRADARAGAEHRVT
jgi:phosphotransacetylase